ncbi:MAG: hydrolase or acyltransferase, alpha/beta fold family [Firmicutes bacterium]|nr:hydrolase or acyltransferase, alpha/beta fold family [Bacillota bacterium]
MVQFLVLGNDQFSTAAASNKYPQEASKMVICGSGSFVISAAGDLWQRELCHQRGQDRPPAHESHHDSQHVRHGRCHRKALKHSLTLEERKQIIAEAAEQRYVEFTGGKTKYTTGTVHELKEDTHPIQREFFEFYRTPRGNTLPKARHLKSQRIRLLPGTLNS